MESITSFPQVVREAAKKKVLFLPHAVKQMSRSERMITPAEVQHVIDKGEMIEDYPGDVRGPSCLMLGLRMGRQPIHVVCSPREDYLAIITAYVPDKKQWTDNFRERRT